MKKANVEQAELNRKNPRRPERRDRRQHPARETRQQPIRRREAEALVGLVARKLRTDRYFSKGTKVWTQVGPVPIEQILVGDRVLARDPATRDLTFEFVICTDTQPGGTMRAVTVDSELIATTSDQQFFTADKGWQNLSFILTIRSTRNRSKLQRLPCLVPRQELC